MATTPLPLADVLAKDYNFIERIVRIYPLGTRTGGTSDKELSIKTAFSDPGFFELFGFDLQAGNKKTILSLPNTIVITDEVAAKYFANNNPIGKVISLGNLGEFQVTGIIRNGHRKSHIDFDGYISMSSVPILEASGKLARALGEWSNGVAGYTYISVKPGTRSSQLKQALQQVSASVEKNSTLNGKESFDLAIQPLDDIILGEELLYSLGNTGSKEKVFAEIAICFVLLLSACFNYTNLSLARSLKRGKEVGVRKVAGAFRFQIFYQFMLESVFIAFLALGFAFAIFKLIIDYAPFGEVIPQGVSIDIGLIGWFIAFTLFTGLIAGALPAWALSAFKPVEVLKNLSNIRLFGSNGLRKTLIVVQFALSLIIIVFTATFYKQFKYLASADPGFNVRNILNIKLNGADHEVVSREISRLNGVELISATSTNLGRSAAGSVAVKPALGSEPIKMEYYDVDGNFISNMGLTLVAGNIFSINTTGLEKEIVITDIARKILQYPSPSDAVGQLVWLNDSTQVRIAGVMKDFFYRGLETPYGPMVLRNRPETFNYLHIKASRPNDENLVSAVQSIWKANNPTKLFEYTWLYDELVARKGARDMVSTLGYLAIITITLACMGLLGMVVYNTETRKKEIGIRKVMGASVATIMTLLSRNFIRLVVIAGLIALPVSYVLSYTFLNIFANRINIGFGILTASFLGMLFLSLITIGTQIYRVAMANPVESLRTE